MSLIFHHVDTNELIRRVAFAKGAVVSCAPGAVAAFARADGTAQTPLECESRGHAARMALGCGRDAKMILGCWWNVLQRTA